MKIKVNNAPFRFIILMAAILLFGAAAFAQEKTVGNFCQSYNYSNSGKVSFNELREINVPAGNLLTVDARRNGGIHVSGSNRADVLVRACIQTWGKSDEAAQSLARGIRIESGSIIRAENAADENDWAVSYEILVPRAMNLKLTAYNGGISLSSVEGNIEFETINGGLHLANVAGNLKGRTTNGGLHVELSGDGWKGGGLDVQTTNGGVHLTMPENYAAHIETGTVNGGFTSDIAGLNADRKDRSRAARISTDLNGGGATVRVITTNGGVKINSAGK